MMFGDGAPQCYFSETGSSLESAMPPRRASTTAEKSLRAWPWALAFLKHSFAAAATGMLVLLQSPICSAKRMSFCACSSGKCGAYLRFSWDILPPFMRNMGFAIAPASRTSSNAPTGRSLRSQSMMPSPSAAIIDPMIMLTASFIRAPAPMSPRKTDFLPIAWRSCSPPESTRSKSPRSPPAKNTSAPFSAGTFEPLTGASRKRPPAATIASWDRRESDSVIVEQSTTLFPEVTPCTAASGISKST
mmetsp:Transcript_2256/g.6115  ORF Transcript_2256/g.6115 Transcript_2256/m.6115 type:complete len:246 (-) Transcript_2256:498-1235(-)